MTRPQVQQGAVMAIFAIALLGMLLMCGLAIDVGLLYTSRAALSKGVDAAALMGVRSIGQGEATARSIAENTFAMNYAASGLAAGQVEPPTLSIAFSTDAVGNRRIDVGASLRMRTFFLRLLPGRDIMSVGSSAQATHAKLIMGIALDRSGSMTSNGGSSALPGAVTSFVNYFDETSDRVSLSSYADHARVDVSMRYSFKTPIRTTVKNLGFDGWTYSHGGIDSARAQINSVVLPAPENVVKALVFFTDGHANAFLGDVSAGDVKCTGNKAISLVLVPGADRDDFRDPANGSTVTCNANRTRDFYSQKYGGNRTRNTANVTEEGLYNAERSAALARANNTLVFAIGLGSDINQSSLRKMANDRSSPSFDPAQPEGMAVFAPTAAELDDVFRQIAAKILLRLTR